jgi:hypothetical protein
VVYCIRMYDKRARDGHACSTYAHHAVADGEHQRL